MAQNILVSPEQVVLLTGNPMWFNVITDTPLTAALRLNVVVNYSLDYGTTWGALSNLILPYNSFTSTCIFDIRKLVDDLIDIPEIGFYNGVSPTPISVQFYITTFETLLGDNTPTSGNVSGAVYTGIKGVSNYLQASELSNYTYNSYYQNKFLTNMPKVRNVHEGQALCFSFANLIFPQNTRTFRLFWAITYDDGYLVYAYFDSLEHQFGQVSTFVFDESLFDGYNPNPAAKIRRLSCTLQLVAGTTTNLDNITYTYVQAPSKRSRHFMWLNNLGGYDFLTCTGLLEQRMEVEGDLYQKVVARNDYNSQEVDLSEINLVPDLSYKINTGMKAAGEIDGFLTFFLSKQALLYRKDITEAGSSFWFLPVGKKIDGTYRKDKDYTNALGFEFFLLFSSHTPFVLK